METESRGCQGPGGGQWEVTVYWVLRGSIWDDENVLEMDSGDGCKTLWTYNQCCWFVYVKVVKLVKFMLCIFLLVVWASLVAQMVKNLPAMWETWVRFLGLEDPLEEGMATHSNILGWRIPLGRGAWWAIVHGVAESDTNEHPHSTQLVVLPLSHVRLFRDPMDCSPRASSFHGFP